MYLCLFVFVVSLSFQTATLSHKRNTEQCGKGTWFEPMTPLCLRGRWINCKRKKTKQGDGTQTHAESHIRQKNIKVQHAWKFLSLLTRPQTGLFHFITHIVENGMFKGEKKTHRPYWCIFGVALASVSAPMFTSLSI